MKSYDGKQLKLKLFVIKYAGEARSWDLASQCAASHIAQHRCGSGGEHCEQAADALCKFFQRRGWI